MLPNRDAFDALASAGALAPVWTELLADVSTPVGVFPALAGDGPGVLLESVERSERWGRYSFVAGNPAAIVVLDEGGLHVHDVVRDLGFDVRSTGNARRDLVSLATRLRAPRVDGLPSLTGGLVGFLSYEAAQLVDGHPVPPGETPAPPIGLLVVDRAIVFDHWRQRLLLVAHVPAGGYDDAVDALDELSDRVSSPAAPPPEPLGDGPHDSGGGEANMTDDHFLDIVRTMKEHVFAGDVYQVVPSRRVSFTSSRGGLPVYRRLRVTNPAPYMFFVRMLGLELAGSSPEPLVRVEGRTVVSRPIAGTRPRGETELRDRLYEHELLADPKERAEHAMLVDLARNDLGRVCVPGTVRPTELMVVERFSKVMHIVSTVEGELANGCHPLDALSVTFPAGTVTGAPKRRAMELIAEHEPTPRGPYAGAVGYCTFAGDLDFCITIRTAVVADGRAHVQTGAGIVADSDPHVELEETNAKAAALLPAVVDAEGVRGAQEASEQERASVAPRDDEGVRGAQEASERERASVAPRDDESTLEGT